LLVGVPLAADQLTTHRGSGQPTIQPGGLEGGIGLYVVLDDVLDVLQQAGQVKLSRLASAAAEGIDTRHAGASFLERFADGVASPAEELATLPLSQSEGFDGVRDVSASPRSHRQRLCGTDDQITHFRSNVHTNPSCP
jgi:hypothetical protein